MKTKLGFPAVIASFVIFWAGEAVRGEGPDVVLADFEGQDYGDWKATGDAFGPGPAHGALPGQMTVSGFEGKGWVSSFNGGDRSTGTLTSPEFPIGRKFLTFLIGGGGWEGQTCLNLLVDGAVVRTATGPNTRPGGSEALELKTWDVGEFAGKPARLEVVDRANGGWGHINVDRIVLTDRKPPALVADRRREFLVERRYLHLPVRDGAAVRKVTLLVDGRAEPSLDIRLADSAPDWWAFLDVGPWRGQALTVRVDKLPEDSEALDAIAQGDDAIKGGDDLYRERLRPQFHFSSRRGWLNDPNGLVFYRGEYHLFYQHNPYGWEWGNMHWGHAVGRDLVHWQELGDVLAPDDLGPMFSGSAVVDRENTSGFGKDGQPPLVLVYTAAGRPSVQCLAYSTDGRTFTKYGGNPVVPQINAGNRDPKVIWHEPTRRWVMVLYVGLPDPTGPAENGRPAQKHTIHFLTSPDLKAWTDRGQVEGFYECPDLFELPVDGEGSRKTWVLSAANTDYMLGRFDGERFMPESPILTGRHGDAFYAPQTFSDMPDGRRVQIGWGRMPSPGMPFNQMMCFPCTLTLRRTADGPRLRWWPVDEIATLDAGAHAVSPLPRPLKPGENPLEGVRGELCDIRAEFDVGDAAAVGLAVRGTEVVYDAGKRELICKDRGAPLAAEGGRVRLRILADRTSLEIFGDDGMVYMPMAVLPREGDASLAAFARGGTATLRVLDVHELRPIWPAPR